MKPGLTTKQLAVEFGIALEFMVVLPQYESVPIPLPRLSAADPHQVVALCRKGCRSLRVLAGTADSWV